MSEKRKPITSLKQSGIEVAKWDNDGKISYSIKKMYKLKDSEEWKETNYYFPDQLPVLKEMLENIG